MQYNNGDLAFVLAVKQANPTLDEYEYAIYGRAMEKESRP